MSHDAGDALTGKIVRKFAYWWRNYASRLRNWSSFLRDVEGVSLADKVVLGLSALASPVTSLFELNYNRPPLLLTNVTVREKHSGIFTLRAGTDDPFHIMAGREPKLLALLEEMLRPGDVFVDAGANIGFYSLAAARKLGVDGRVFAVEMMPETAQLLRRNLAASDADNVAVVETALASEAGRQVTARFDPSRLGQASVAIAGGHARKQTVVVTTSRLDEVVPAGPVRLMKMDLEGAEYDALLGASDLLARTDAVVFETNNPDNRIFTLLEEAGFSCEPLENDDFLARREGGAASARHSNNSSSSTEN